jgi:hypothetical protein
VFEHIELREEVTRSWRKLHDWSFIMRSPDIRTIKSRRMIQAEHVARMGDTKMHTFWSGNLKGRDHSQDLGVDGRLKWILKK